MAKLFRRLSGETEQLRAEPWQFPIRHQPEKRSSAKLSVDSASIRSGISAPDRYDLSVRSRASLRVVGSFALLIFASSQAIDLRSEPATLQTSETTLLHLVEMVRSRAKTLESSSGMRESFQSFTSSYKIAPGSISYSDFVIVRLLYEATRDAGLWNMHWTITEYAAEFRSVWRQWKEVRAVSPQTANRLRGVRRTLSTLRLSG